MAVPPGGWEEWGQGALVPLAPAAERTGVSVPDVAPADLRREPVDQQVAVDAA